MSNANPDTSSATPAYTALTATFTRLYRLNHLSSIVGWDQAAMMPPKGNAARGAALAELQVLIGAWSAFPTGGFSPTTFSSSPRAPAPDPSRLKG